MMTLIRELEVHLEPAMPDLIVLIN